MKLLRRALATLGVLSLYHLALAYLGALLYGFPSRHMTVIGVTGTKGKSSTTEMLNVIFESAGHTTAVLNSIRIKITDDSQPNRMRMSMPGRFFIQRFLSDAQKAGCSVVILEMTSEGARQHRHRAIALDALLFLNLAPEHIESHGSYEAYANAKFSIGEALARSSKRPRIMVANADDPEGERYLHLPVEQALPFSIKKMKQGSDDRSVRFEFEGSMITIPQPGEFSVKNGLAAATAAHALGIPLENIIAGLAGLDVIPGRAERIEAGQDFTVIVDYAHTPDSLTALYSAYPMRKICVLGLTGGGRDTWKRPVMGAIADERCDEVILTNEDPYDEDPRAIVDAMASGMKRMPTIIMDRRQAIAHAVSIARTGDAVLITGKGTDPTIAGPNGTKTQWSDAAVAREELEKRAQ